MFKRIAIIGNYASGKTTFSNKLGKLLQIDVYHLDDIFFKKKQENPDFDWEQYQLSLVNKKNWIIEGNFPRTWNIRTKTANQIFYFDFPIWKSLFRYFYRKFRFHTRDGVGIREIKKIIFFPRLNIDNDCVIVFRTNKESDTYLKNLSLSTKSR
jgi:adenylate kinase family enzyme